MVEDASRDKNLSALPSTAGDFTTSTRPIGTLLLLVAATFSPLPITTRIRLIGVPQKDLRLDNHLSIRRAAGKTGFLSVVVVAAIIKFTQMHNRFFPAIKALRSQLPTTVQIILKIRLYLIVVLMVLAMGGLLGSNHSACKPSGLGNSVSTLLYNVCVFVHSSV